MVWGVVPSHILGGHYSSPKVPCKAINPILEAISEKMSDKVIIANHDIDSDPNFATQSQIKSIPTIFAYKNGSHTDTHVGASDQATLEKFISKNL